MGLLKNTPLILTIYALALVGSCIGAVQGWHGLEQVCKPLLMIILSSWFFFSSRRVGDRFTLLIQVGLLFSLIGDVAMMFTYLDDFNFLMGLGAFLVAQLCYAMAFAHNIADVGGTGGMLASTLIAFAIGTYAFFFTWDLTPHLDDGLEGPVIAYVAAIALMGILAAFRYRRTYPLSFWMVMIGSVLFIASDSFLALDRFRNPMEWASVWIMVTYAAAQFLIAGGALAHVLDPDNLRKRQALTT